MPPDPYGLVTRHRLIGQIRQAPANAITWIAAPPAAGKSSLAATWLREQNAAVHGCGSVWYRLDESDTDPSLFFLTLKNALVAIPGVDPEVFPKPTPEALLNLDDFAKRWFRVLLQEDVRPPCLFVFDDIHRVPPGSTPLRILPLLAALLRPRDQVLCLSRQPPPDEITSRLAKSRLVQISELQVQEDEFEDFERDLGQAASLTRSNFVTQLRRSGHWIADLVIAPSAPAVRTKLSVQSAADFSRIFSRFGEAERASLLATAYLQAGDEAEWRALGGEDAGRAIARLADERAFVTRLVNGSFRKHDCFHTWLKTAAETTLAPVDLVKARGRTGRLLATRNELLAGARLLIDADAPDELRTLVVRQAAGFVASGRHRELLELLTMLPEPQQAEPAGRLWHAYAGLPFEPQGARAEFAQLWRGLDPTRDGSVYAAAVCGEVKAALADWSVDRRLMSLVAETAPAVEAMQKLPEPDRQKFMIGRCLAILIGDPSDPDGLESQRELEAIMPRLPPSDRLSTGSMLANYFLWWRGNLEASRFHVEALRSLVGRSDIPPLATLSWYNAATALAFRDADGEAVRHLAEEAQAFAHKWGITPRLSTIFWLLAQAVAAEGRHREAVAALHQYEKTANWSRRIGWSGSHILKAALALSAGDHDQAIGEATAAQKLIQTTGSAQEIGSQLALLAPALAATGSDAAAPSISQLYCLASQGRNAVFALHADLAETYLAHAQGRMSEFVQHWERMAEGACALQFRRMTGMNPQYLSRLVNAALTHGANVEITRQLVHLWNLTPLDGDHVHENWPYPVEVACLGGFTIHINGKKTKGGQGKAQRKPLELLWTLIPACEVGVSQELLADQLWPELDGDRAMHSLRTTLYRLRKIIGPDAIMQEDDHVRLNPNHVITDLSRLQKALSRLRNTDLTDTDRMAALDQSLRL